MKKLLMAVVLMVMSGRASAAQFSDLAVKAADLEALAATDGFTIPAVHRGYVVGNGSPRQIEWITINGGKFTMGTDSDGHVYSHDASPIHDVSIKAFEMSRTHVTVFQYAECVKAGKCTVPYISDGCNWGVAGRETHPVNCVSWTQAKQYAKFKGARLPSESEWEYAATSGGKNQKYPWGNEDATCDLAVMALNNVDGCGKMTTLPVCSKPAGNTAQGLCDMAGNVWQWMQDKYQDSYSGVPADGSAFEGAAHNSRVLRGGAFDTDGPVGLRADYRSEYPEPVVRPFIGFRLARSR